MNRIKTERIKKLLKSFKGKKILIVGDIMLDTYVWGTVSRISPEAPVPVVNINRESYALGGAANVANNVCSLGGKVYLVGVVGDDDISRKVFSELHKRKVDTNGLFIDKNRPTTLKTRIVAHSQQVVRLDKEKKGKMSESISKKIFNYIKKSVKEVDAVIISDYAKGIVVPKVTKELILLGKKYKKHVVVDPQIDHFHTYQGVSCLTPNHHEAGFAAGIPIVDKKTLISAGKKLLNNLQCRGILITQGEKGMSLFEKNKKLFKIPTMAREIYDVTGAGDTVISALSLALASGSSMPEAAYIGNIAASVVVGKIGTASANIKEIFHQIDIEKV